MSFAIFVASKFSLILRLRKPDCQKPSGKPFCSLHCGAISYGGGVANPLLSFLNIHSFHVASARAGGRAGFEKLVEPGEIVLGQFDVDGL